MAREASTDALSRGIVYKLQNDVYMYKLFVILHKLVDFAYLLSMYLISVARES